MRKTTSRLLSQHKCRLTISPGIFARPNSFPVVRLTKVICPTPEPMMATCWPSRLCHQTMAVVIGRSLVDNSFVMSLVCHRKSSAASGSTKARAGTMHRELSQPRDKKKPVELCLLQHFYSIVDYMKRLAKFQRGRSKDSRFVGSVPSARAHLLSLVTPYQKLSSR